MFARDDEEELNAFSGEDAASPEDDASDEYRKKADEYLANWQRTQADFMNYKRRTEQERREFLLNANAELLRKVLPILDDLERALDHAPDNGQGQEWLEGTRLVEKKFRATLENVGVKPLLALGMAFDPTIHEAIHQDKGPEGTVIGEFQKGYMLHDKLLRPARVIVGNGEGDAKEEE
jgi:molecular chaperone GrpE